MGSPFNMTDREKELLTALGRFPNSSMKELLARTHYKWVSTIVRKIEYFKKLHMIWGPFYDINYDRLCRNPFHKLYCIFESNQSYETVRSYLTLIESLIWIYPVFSPHKELINAGFFSTDDDKMRSLFELLKLHNIITDYNVHVYCSKKMTGNPDFFGPVSPSFNTLRDNCDIPDMSLAHHDTVWNASDFVILPYLWGGANLVEILKREKKCGRTWKYSQIRYSREKMTRNNLIEKKYLIFPFPSNTCSIFDFFLKTEEADLTQRILFNFGRGGRLHREYVLFEDRGLVHCKCHSTFLIDLLHNLDRMDGITEKELYHLRSTTGTSILDMPLNIQYFDIEHQTLHYPYCVFEETIKEKLEREGVN